MGTFHHYLIFWYMYILFFPNCSICLILRNIIQIRICVSFKIYPLNPLWFIEASLSKLTHHTTDLGSICSDTSKSFQDQLAVTYEVFNTVLMFCSTVRCKNGYLFVFKTQPVAWYTELHSLNQFSQNQLSILQWCPFLYIRLLNQ